MQSKRDKIKNVPAQNRADSGTTEEVGNKYEISSHNKPGRPRGGVEVQLYSYLTSALDGVGGQRLAPAALPPGKTRYCLYRRLGGHQGRSGQVRKIIPFTEIRSPERPARSESL